MASTYWSDRRPVWVVYRYAPPACIMCQYARYCSVLIGNILAPLTQQQLADTSERTWRLGADMALRPDVAPRSRQDVHARSRWFPHHRGRTDDGTQHRIVHTDPRSTDQWVDCPRHWRLLTNHVWSALATSIKANPLAGTGGKLEHKITP